MIGKLICGLPKWMGGGHKRGKRVGNTESTIIYRCPRCKDEWMRPVAKPKAGV